MCLIEARLIFDREEVQAEPSEWQPEAFIADEVTDWDWVVRPSRAGELRGVLQIRPAVLGQEADETYQFQTENRSITVHAWQSRWQWLAVTLERASPIAVSISAIGAAVLTLFGILKLGPQLRRLLHGWRTQPSSTTGSDETRRDGYL